MIAAIDRAGKKALLDWARSSIRGRLEDIAPGPPPTGPGLEATCGAFVSLHEAGRLRGCIGRIVGGGPVVETIRAMALAAAFEDPRFNPLTAAELSRVDIEITLLSPLEKLGSASEVVVGKHGLYIVKGWHSGLLLPQVPVEFGWDRDTFLEQVCYKAGLHAGAWKEKDSELFAFEGILFGEKEGLD
jgi:AmmeMemoRadiSam system protein A